MLAKLLFFLIGTFFLQCRSQEKQISGKPEVDYPTYYVIPKTSFRCSDQLYNPGFYADTETRCQVFHYCYEHRQESFLCPMGTIFNQPILACDYWYSSNCSLAPSYYHVNAVKKNPDFSDEVYEPLESESENLFSKMSNLYEVNKPSESPVLKNTDTSEEEYLGRESDESSSEPLIERNNETEDYNKYSYDTQLNMVDEKHPDIVKYEDAGLYGVKVHKGSENEQLYETYNGKDFILSEDGMLHINQDDIYHLYPTDMNFDQAYSGYSEIPSDRNLNDNLNVDYESDFQMSDLELQKRYSNFRRQLNRKPIIIAPEVEPEIMQLPVVKPKRKFVGEPLTTSTIENGESLYETIYDSNIHNEDTVSIVNEDIKGAASISNFNYDPKLFYENRKRDSDENGSYLHQTKNTQVIYDYSNNFGSESNDLSSISNAEQQNTVTHSNTVDESETFIENSESSIVFHDESLDAAVEGSFDRDLFLGSGLEENIIQPHSNDKSSFSENQDVFSDSEGIENNYNDISNGLSINILENFEGSGISAQKFAEETNDPTEFILKDDSEGEISFPMETFEKFSPSENSQHSEGEALLPDGSSGYSEFDYFPHELQESADIHDTSNKIKPEIQEIDGSYYYVFSDPEYQSNSEYEVSNEFYSKNEDYAIAEKLDVSSDKLPEELIENVNSHYVPVDSKPKTESTEKLSNEFEMEVSSTVSEEHLTDDNVGELSNEDINFLKLMSEIPMPNNLFDVSNEKTNSDTVVDEISLIEISDQGVTHDSTDSIEDSYVPESLSSDIEDNSSDIQSSEINPEISEAEQKMAEDDSLTESSGQEESDIFLHEQNLETLAPGKEIDPFNPLYTDGDEIFGSPENKYYPVTENLDGSATKSSKELISNVGTRYTSVGSKLKIDNTKKLSGSRQKSSLKINSVEPTITLDSTVSENLKKVKRGKRFNENFRTFNPSSKGNPLISPSRETFRDTVFSNIPTAFLKMKHSSLRPYFYNYNSRNSGVDPFTGDLSESSKLSKLTSLGKRLLAAKRSKFNPMEKIYRFLQI